jgi:protein-L-isoaspartate(D-aspartate) O-methyltransferase
MNLRAITSAARVISRRQVQQAMRTLSRRDFVPGELADQAEEDRPLAIGCGQTISQPSLVAFMTAALRLQPEARVLEIGTGSGFQTALLSRLVREVLSVEIIPELAETATIRLREQGCANVRVRCGDGYQGWPEHAPYDAVIVTAAAESVPPPLVAQLVEGGRLIAPLGPVNGPQELVLLRKTGTGVTVRRLFGVRFVPLTRRTD